MSEIVIESIPRPTRPPGALDATFDIAQRVARKYFRTPGLFVMGIVQSAGFLFMFRYVFGGAIHAGTAGYVEYLVPGYAGTIMLFTGGATAVGVAEDRAQGLTDRLLSLPVSRGSLVAGRVLADFLDERLDDHNHRRARIRVRFPPSRLDAGRPDRSRTLPALWARLYRLFHSSRPLRAERSGGSGHVDDRVHPRLYLERLRTSLIDARLASRVREVPARSPQW